MGGIPKSFLLLAAILTGLSSGAGVRVQGFSFSGVSNRFITPNGDGRNDNVAFQFSNPRDSAGTVKIYNVRGRLVTTLSVNPGDVSEIWDGRSNGQVVNSGIYVFVIDVENTVASGTVVVVR
jgi:gliding motility-associated-like protein